MPPAAISARRSRFNRASVRRTDRRCTIRRCRYDIAWPAGFSSSSVTDRLPRWSENSRAWSHRRCTWHMNGVSDRFAHTPYSVGIHFRGTTIAPHPRCQPVHISIRRALAPHLMRANGDPKAARRRRRRGAEDDTGSVMLPLGGCLPGRAAAWRRGPDRGRRCLPGAGS